MIYLPIEINDAAQIPWVPAGANEQWIKDYLDKYVKTPAFAATLAALGGASKNLSNVDAKDFEKKAKDGNFAQNDLADVDLAKLKEKGYSSTKIREEKLIGQSYLQQLRHGELVSWKTLDTICTLLDCQPGDLLEYVREAPGDR